MAEVTIPRRTGLGSAGNLPQRRRSASWIAGAGRHVQPLAWCAVVLLGSYAFIVLVVSVAAAVITIDPVLLRMVSR